MESEFLPVLIYNNRKGRDAEILEQFNEPSWNNPVIRYLTADQKDLIPRKDGVWTTAGTAARMVAALEQADRTVPGYLAAFDSSANPGHEQATFAMHCYWEGEAKLGSIPGVTSTQSAWHDSLEVVTLKFDPNIVGFGKLVDQAQSLECATRVVAHTDDQLKLARAIVGDQAVPLAKPADLRTAKASDQKYYLLQTPLRHLSLTETQATKINAALNANEPIKPWLSPRQIELHKRILKITQREPDALAQFHYPASVADLGEYAHSLERQLEKLEAVPDQSRR